MGVTREKIQELSDEEIVEVILETGDSRFFETIYDRYALKVYQKCLSFTKDTSEAKDVAHDVMVKLYLSLSKFSGKSKFSTWFYAITYNHCVDHQSRKRKELKLQEEIKRDYKSGSLAGIEPKDEEILGIRLEKLYALLDKLTVSEKSILLMKYQDGMSIREIADITRSGESALKMKLKRSKEKLIKLYEQERT